MIDILELFKIAGRIDLEGADKAEKELDRIDGKGKSVGARIGSAAKKVAKGGAVMAAGFAGAFAGANKVAGSLDDIAKGAQRVGVSTDFYQELDFWASQNGMSHEQMEKAIGRFNQRLGQATQGNEKYANALAQMGVNMEDVESGAISTEDAFAQSIKSLSEIESETEQVAIATEMFGTRMARQMLPALQDGALSLEDAQKKAEELGIVMDGDAIDAGVKFADTWDQLKRSMSQAGMQIGSQLLPIFQTMMDWVIQNMPMIQSVFETVFEVIGQVLGVFKEVLVEVFDFLQTFYENNKENFELLRETIVNALTQVWEYMQEIWEMILEFWEEHGEAIVELAVEYFTMLWENVKFAFDTIWEIIQTVLDLVVPFIEETLAKIFEFWEENGEQIMQAVKNAFDFIKGVIETVMPIVTTIIETAWGLISGIIDTAIGIIMGLIKTFSSLLTGDFEGIKEGLLGIWESLWEGIKDFVSGAWDMLSGVFESLWSNISGWFTDLGSDALGWGKDMITGFWEGIKGMGGWIKKKLGDWTKKFIPGPIKKVLGISSPSKLMMEYGEDTGEGMEIGLERKGRDVQRASENIAQTIATNMNPIGNTRLTQPQAQSNTTHNEYSFARMFEGAQFSVRNDNDIKQLARELGDYIKGNQRAKGVVVR